MRELGVVGFAIRLPFRLTVFVLVAATLVASVSPSVVLANDSVARFGAGGIEFIRNEHIRMVEETLEISTKEVRVRYRFLNESEEDIHTTVAFPFPRYNPFWVNEISEGDGPQKIMSTFTVLVNDTPVSKKIVRKAYLGDRDITDLLRKSGLSDDEIFFDVSSSKERTVLLEKLRPVEARLGGWWEIDGTATWEMTFPAGKEIVVEHSYSPAVGGFYGVGKIPNPHSGKDYSDKVCLDESTRRAIEIRIKACAAKDPEMVFVTVRDVEYIMSTGRNWKGPIGKFILRIKKDTPDHFTSLCFPGSPERVSPTTYEFCQKDFVPPDRLIVYFYFVGPEVR